MADLFLQLVVVVVWVVEWGCRVVGRSVRLGAWVDVDVPVLTH